MINNQSIIIRDGSQRGGVQRDGHNEPTAAISDVELDSVPCLSLKPSSKHIHWLLTIVKPNAKLNDLGVYVW